MLRIILYTRTVHAVFRQGFTQFTMVGSEVSMTEAASVNLRPYVFNQQHGPAPYGGLLIPTSLTSIKAAERLSVLYHPLADLSFPKVHSSPWQEYR